ncbi:MAG: PPOX class F420-dependent oxidoreductase [bacterium]
MDLQSAIDFAADRSKGVILTIKANGLPHASNIVYATFDGAVHASVTDRRAKTANVRRDPRAALHVSSDDFRSWVVLEGDVRLSPVATHPMDEAATMLRRVYEAIAGPHPDWDEFDRAMIDQRRLVLTIQPEGVYGQAT